MWYHLFASRFPSVLFISSEQAAPPKKMLVPPLAHNIASPYFVNANHGLIPEVGFRVVEAGPEVQNDKRFWAQGLAGASPHLTLTGSQK